MNYLGSVGEMEFNVFEFCNMAENDGLASMMVFLFDENDLFEKLNIEFQTFYAYMKKIQAGSIHFIFFVFHKFQFYLDI